jgi:hypothetical protein
MIKMVYHLRIRPKNPLAPFVLSKACAAYGALYDQQSSVSLSSPQSSSTAGGGITEFLSS